MFAIKPPPAAPTYSAGAKIPPKKPNPIQSDVIKTLPIKIINRNIISYWLAKILFISFVPSPSISGTNSPIDPQINAAKSIWYDGDNLVAFEVFPPKRILNIKNIASAPNIGEQINTIGTISISGGASEIIFKPKVSLKTPDPIVEAVIEEIAIAPPALKEKCLSTASWANTSPAIGALKPAEIAAATPQPINIPGGNLFDVKFSKNVATVAPKCTKGPYWPTEAPPLAETNAVSVDPNPRLTSIELLDWCAAKIASGGPCHLVILKTFLIKIIIIAATKSDIIGENDNTMESENKVFRKFVAAATPFTKRLETIPSVHPTLKPIKRSANKSIAKFLTFIKIITILKSG